MRAVSCDKEAQRAENLFVSYDSTVARPVVCGPSAARCRMSRVVYPVGCWLLVVDLEGIGCMYVTATSQSEILLMAKRPGLRLVNVHS